MHFLRVNFGADYFEIGMLLGACFLVNWVTSDAKTNMSEGLTMITFYVMIVRDSVHQPILRLLLLTGVCV